MLEEWVVKRLFDGITWLTAVLLAVLFTFVQFGFAIFFDDEGRLTLFWIVVSVAISILSQVGLFLSPWAVNFRRPYQLLVIAIMLPSVWGICSELANVAGLTALVPEPSKHVGEIITLSLILAVYIGQLSLIGYSFIRRRIVSAGRAT
ncbi:MAG: hypothetical protein LC746_15440 [Acidobacteria bacterium]|nr:hypothetical protein [Acidobacteriota bacterium]